MFSAVLSDKPDDSLMMSDANMPTPEYSSVPATEHPTDGPMRKKKPNKKRKGRKLQDEGIFDAHQ